MGVFAGSITYRRYRVVGDLPEDYRNRFFEAIQKRIFREIDISSDEERTFGWVGVGDVLDLDLTMEKIFFGSNILLTLRTDTLKVPGAALKLVLRQAEKEFMTDTKKERLSKQDKEEIKEHVIKTLRKRLLPSVKGIDMVWDVSTATVRFWSHNKTMGDLFTEVFFDTFGLRLVPRTPYTAMADVGLSDEMSDRALKLDPADFVGSLSS
ncbi:MAG: recombination-associated protein RdgC [Myxococcales bacterium]|nr:recombination-associated protein RdgC [Myxococcales bacterium]